MPKGSFVNRFTYSSPDPFVLPAIETQGASLSAWWNIGPVTLIPHECLQYSAKVLEECMLNITKEYNKREMTAPIWKKYKSAIDDYDVFTPNVNGDTLKNVPVKYFYRYVLDIQSAIDTLLADTDIPDSRASYLARIFCNNTITNGVSFNDITKLKDNIVCPGSGSTHNPLTEAQNGNWPFAESYFAKISPLRGISLKGEKSSQVKFNQGAGTIEAFVDGFPASEIGQKEADGSVGGFDSPMTSANRPTISRVSTKNSSQGVGKGQIDKDLGYAHLAHDPKIIHQLRWQPSDVEFWPTPVPIRDYVSNIYSNTTPNLPWYFGQPVENTWKQNWGYWLLKGKSGVLNSKKLSLQVYQNPMAESATIANCPYAVFYPPPTANCTCGWTETAYAIWFVTGLSWEGQTFYNSPTAKPKYFGPKTKLKMQYTYTGSDGDGDSVIKKLQIGVKTSRIGEQNNQPFSYIYSTTNPLSGTLNINIQQAMNTLWSSSYPIGGLDAITAIIIQIDAIVSSTWTCEAVPYLKKYPNGGVDAGLTLPDSCFTEKICTIPTCTLQVDWIKIEEDAITGDPVNDYK